MKRFTVAVYEHNPEEEDGWTHQLIVTDNAFRDQEGYPPYAHAAGQSWGEAFEAAAEMVARALDRRYCIFTSTTPQGE